MKNFIYSVLIISSFLYSCSEYPEAIEPETNPTTATPQNSISANVFPVHKIKQIQTSYKILADEPHSTKKIKFPGLYDSTTSYDEDGSVIEHGTIVLETPAKPTPITFSKSSEIWRGNFAIEKSNKIYAFKNNQIQEINDVKTSETTVFTFDENSAQISTSSKKLLNVLNDIKLKFDEKGYLKNASVSSRISNKVWNIHLETTNHEIQYIHIESDGKLLGTLSFEYDNQFNPFSIHPIEDSEVIKSIFALTLADLTIDDSKSVSENALKMAKHLSQLGNFSETNVLAIRWNNELVLTKSYTYNKAGYPTKILIDSKMAVAPKVLTLDEELNFALKGSETISYY